MGVQLDATSCGGIFESQNVVLGLLELPTRRMMACMNSIIFTTSHCSMNTYRIPYDDDVFAAKGLNKGPNFDTLQPQGWGMMDEESRHLRPIGMSAIRTIMSPYSMGLTVARNMSLACLNLAHRHILLLTEAEEKAIETGKEPDYIPFPWEDLPDALKHGGIHSGMDVAVLSVRGLLDLAAEGCFSRLTSTKMHTDLRRTAKDMLVGYSAWQRIPRVIKTSLFSEITLFASEWVVSCVLDVTRLVLSKKEHIQKRILIKIGMHGARCSSLWLAVSLGNGMGSSSPKLQPLCMLACAHMCSFLVNSFYASMTARIEKLILSSSDKKKDGGDGGSETPGLAERCTSLPRGPIGPESPDIGTQMQSGGLDSPEPSIAFSSNDNASSNVEPSSVTHTISSKGPRLPPRRKISLYKNTTGQEKGSDRDE